MEFGIFSQMHCPPWDDEHSRYLRELEVSELCDTVGFKYDWSPEHHFLEHYSHQPAPEVFLSWVAARTKRIHVGTAITNITAAVNHPARVAERIATMDHLSEGRVEFGTGRGSSSAEWGGFDIPSAAETKPMWRESLEQIPRMWRDEPYAFEGKYFRMPERDRAAEAVLEAASAHVGGVLEPADLRRGGRARPRRPLLHLRHARRHRRARQELQGRASSAAPSPSAAYVNDNIAVTTNMFCLDDGDEARHLYAKAKVERVHRATSSSGSTPSRVRRACRRPDPIPPLPDPTPAELQAGLAVGGRQIGSPDEIARVDRDVRGARRRPAHLRAAHAHPRPEVRPALDRDVRTPRAARASTDPMHSTTRQREAALAARRGIAIARALAAHGGVSCQRGPDRRRWVPAAGGTYPVIDPATEEIAGRAPECVARRRCSRPRARRARPSSAGRGRA